MSETPDAPSPRQYLSFSAEISPITTESLLHVCAQVIEKGIPEVYLLLSTPGGSVMNGMNIYNVLRGMPFNLITHNVGNVDSIGNVVFLAGNERYASPHTTFTYHGVYYEFAQKRFEEKDSRELLQAIQADHARMAAIIAQRASFTDDAEIRKLFLEAETRDTAFAQAKRIIHAVRDVEIPAGAPVHQFVFQR